MRFSENLSNFATAGFPWHDIIVVIASSDDFQFDDLAWQISGAAGRTGAGKSFRVFHAIPFAEPPVGQLRLRDPFPKVDIFVRKTIND